MADTVGQSGAHRGLRWGRWIGGVVLALVVVFAICEALGWPFLAGPMERALGGALDRKVSLKPNPQSGPTATIRFLGGLHIAAPYIEIGAPPWSKEPYSFLARDARITIGYLDLWHASRGSPFKLRDLEASSFDGHVERLADGRASWQFGKKTDTPDTSKASTRLPQFEQLQVKSGTLTYNDALLDADLNAKMSLLEGTNVSLAGIGGAARGLVFEGTGHYRKQPLQIDLRSSNALPAATGDKSVAMPVKLQATIGGASATFDGTATNPVQLTALKGNFSVKGSSLAAAGDPLHVTLPTTPPFEIDGALAKDGQVWNVVVQHASIGASRLAGAFKYDPTQAKPLLSGRVSSSKLQLADLGPSVGASTGKGTPPPPKAQQTPGKVLPERSFDLPSLRAMNANVVIDIAYLDLGSSVLAPFNPLRTHLVLTNGVLALNDIEARSGEGRLTGSLQLDGRQQLAVWNADLQLKGLRLQTFIHSKRGGNAPPYISGRLDAQTRLAGSGKSTAAILGSLQGRMRVQIEDGTVSHLLIEAAGLDVAQSLGVMIKGDDSLKMACSVADVEVTKGVMTPKVMVVDTSDSTLWVTGSVALGSEALDLRLVSAPKDFSPLSLRSPVTLHGTLGDPSVGVEATKLGAKVGAAALLAAIVSPIAAILPLLDFGDKPGAKMDDAQCKALAARMAKQPIGPPQPPARAGSGSAAALPSRRPA